MLVPDSKLSFRVSLLQVQVQVYPNVYESTLKGIIRIQYTYKVSSMITVVRDTESKKLYAYIAYT